MGIRWIRCAIHCCLADKTNIGYRLSKNNDKRFALDLLIADSNIGGEKRELDILTYYWNRRMIVKQ